MNDSTQDGRRMRLRGALVRAAREERATPALRASLLAIAAASAAPVAAGAATGAATEVVATATAKTVAIAHSAAAAKSAGILSALTTSWKLYAAVAIALGSGGALGVVATTTLSERHPLNVQAPATPPKGAPARPAVASPVAVPTTSSTESIPTVGVDELPAAAPPPPAATATARGSSIGNEMRLIDRVRSAVAAGNDVEALRLLDEHHARFPGGMLGEEADVLRIECQARLGRPDAAAQLARAFLERHPASPYAQRVRRTLSRLPVSVQE